MFFDRFTALCNAKGISKSKAVESIGLNRTATVKWKNGAVPSGSTLSKLADFFGVSTDYLLGNTDDSVFIPPEKQKAPTLTKKDERDIAKTMEKLKETLENEDGLMFDGDPMSEEAKASILAAMELGLQAAKLKNKEKYTPKKYKKD